MTGAAGSERSEVFKLDPVDRAIISALQIDDRMSYAELGPRVGLSPAASMPCAHTTMIAFETTPEKLAKHQKKHGGGEGGELFESEKGNQPGVKGRKGLSNATIGALAVGGTR